MRDHIQCRPSLALLGNVAVYIFNILAIVQSSNLKLIDIQSLAIGFVEVCEL